MKFKNKPNFQVKSEDGKEYWISRSVAVVAVILFEVDGKYYLPLGKRSPRLESEANRWGLVCGFLDWDETCYEALVRETYEEIGVDITRYYPPDADIQPHHVWSFSPRVNRGHFV